MQVCLELCFHHLQTQAANIELLCRIQFLLGFGPELQFELAADKTAVSAELHAGHHSCVKYVF